MSFEDVIARVDAAVVEAHLPGKRQLGTLCGMQATSCAGILGLATDGKPVRWLYQVDQRAEVLCPQCARLLNEGNRSEAAGCTPGSTP